MPTWPRWSLVTLVIDAADADAWGQEGVWKDDQCVGSITSGGYGHFVGKSLAIAAVLPSVSALGTELEVDILMERRPATVSAAAQFDPAGRRMRS